MIPLLLLTLVLISTIPQSRGGAVPPRRQADKLVRPAGSDPKLTRSWVHACGFSQGVSQGVYGTHVRCDVLWYCVGNDGSAAYRRSPDE
eukprot:SAG31_NODE_4887_length_2884_cov_2.240575_2_plen_89_part_00